MAPPPIIPPSDRSCPTMVKEPFQQDRPVALSPKGSLLASWEKTEWAMLALALFLLALIMSYLLQGIRDDTFRVERDRLAIQARLIDENITYQLGAINHLLMDIRGHWQERADSRDASVQVSKVLNNFVQVMPGVGLLAVLDGEGKILAGNNFDLVGGHFATLESLGVAPQRPQSDILYVSPPFKDQQGVWAIAFTLAMMDAENQIAGLVVATLEPGFFATLLDSVNYSDDMWTALAYGQGILYLLVPDPFKRAGLDLSQPGSLIRQHLDSGAKTGILRGELLDRGEDRLVALETISPSDLNMSQRLVVATSREIGAIEAHWRQAVYVAMALYSLFVIGTILPQVFRHYRRRGEYATHDELEMQLDQERGRLAAMIEAMQVGMWECDLQSGQCHANERWASFTGHCLAELEPITQATYEGLVHPEDLRDAYSSMEAHFRGNQAYYEHEVRLRHKDGHWVWTLSRGKVVSRTPEGRAAWVMGISLDISAQKRIQEELERVNLELERRTVEAESASQAKSRFLANMSHEIRTPLNAVLGMAQLLAAEAESPRQRQMLENIRSAGRTLLGILNDVLDLSRIEAGELRIDTHPFALNTVLEQVDSLLGSMARSKKLDWRVEAVSLGDDLIGDSLRLEQVLVNLAGNAIKFTEQGEVNLRVLTLDETSRDIRLRFMVRDTGIGMEPQTLSRLFAPFSQADSSTKRRFGGSGLGLYISKLLIEQMGGRIGVESTPGQGSTFWFEIPFSRRARAPVPSLSKKAPASPGLAGACILVVDDSQINLDLIEQLLRRQGAVPILVSDGLQAIGQLRENPGRINAVLMDMQMPIMDGYEATRRIRGELKLTGLPVIAFSAGVLREEQRLMFDAGVNDFVAKPVDLDRLLVVLARWITSSAPPPPPPPVPAAMEPPPTSLGPSAFPLIAGIDSSRAERHFDGDPEFFLTLLGRFAIDLEGEVAGIEASLDQGDAQAARGRLHKLKGMAGNLGATELETATRQLEMAIKGGEADLGEPRRNFLGSASRLLNAFRNWREGKATIPSPVPTPSAPLTTKVVPTQRLQVLLTALADQLTRNRFDAKRTSQAIEALLVGTELAGAYAPVGQSAERLRFNEALTRLEDFRRTLAAE